LTAPDDRRNYLNELVIKPSLDLTYPHICLLIPTSIHIFPSISIIAPPQPKVNPLLATIDINKKPYKTRVLAI